MTNTRPRHSRAKSEPVHFAAWVLAGLVLSFFCGLACSGEPGGKIVSPEQNEDVKPSWCETWKQVGQLYSNPEQQWIQEFRLLARFQYQYANVEGTDSDDSRFSYDTDEIRRSYVGARMAFLQSFEAQMQFDIFEDDKPIGGDRRFESQIWDLFLAADLSEAFTLDRLDALTLGLGRRLIEVGDEWKRSSKYIKTVERSAIANKIWPDDREASNPSGFWAEGASGPLNLTAGLYSTDTSSGLAGGSEGQLYHFSAGYDVSERGQGYLSGIILDGFYQDIDRDEEALGSGLEWVSSSTLRAGKDRWSASLNGIYGDNGDQDEVARRGRFWGLVLLPTYWIWGESLEGVLRYQYQGAEEPQGIRLNSRYVRRADETGDATILNGGRGDTHHSFYAGINYYFCEDNLKVMTGFEYEDMVSAAVHVYDGWTVFLALRTYI